MKKLIFLTLIATNALSAEFTLKWGVNVEPVVYFAKAAARFEERVEKRSAGKIDVQITKNEFTQIGHDHLNDVITGRYHMGQETVFNLQKRIPEFAIWNLPFLFKNDSHVTAYMNSKPAGENLKKLESFGVVGITYTYSGGFLYVVGDKINGLKELSSSNFSLEESAPDYPDYLKTNLSIQPTDLEFSSLQDKLKGAEIIASTTAEEIYPISKDKKLHLNTTDHRVISRVLYISQKFLNSLPENLRKIVLEEAKAAGEFERSLSITDKNKMLKEVHKHNISVNHWSEAKKKSEKLNFNPYYESYKKKFGPESVNFVELLSAGK